VSVPNGFDLHSLTIFLEVVATGSMTAAGTRLRLTQSAVSQVVRQLEEGLGQTLFDRTLRPLALTTAGRLLQDHAQRLVRDAERAVSQLRASGATGLPSLRLGMIDSTAAMLGPAVIEALLSTQQLLLWAGLAPNLSEALLQRRLDLIITAERLDEVDGLDRYSICREPFVLVLPDGFYPGVPEDLKTAVRSLPLARYSARSVMGTQVDLHLRRLNLDFPRTFEFDGSATVLAIVAAGRAWTITTPLCLLQSRDLWPRLQISPLPRPGFSRQLVLVSRSGELGEAPRLVTEAARAALRDTLIPSLLPDLPWLGPRMVLDGDALD